MVNTGINKHYVHGGPVQGRACLRKQGALASGSSSKAGSSKGSSAAAGAVHLADSECDAAGGHGEDEGYDAGRTEFTTSSSNMEWCVKSRTQASHCHRGAAADCNPLTGGGDRDSGG